MRTASTAAIALALVVGFWALGNPTAVAQVSGNDNNIALMDDCLPGDPGYSTGTGGCQLKPHEGDVPSAEFGALLISPLITSTVGHPSWRIEQSHLTVALGKTVRVTNWGGRSHTYTEVANFGGGSVAGFNINMTRAPECPLTPNLVTDAIPPGATGQKTGLAAGLHKFQCCFHPWMRGTIRVQ